MFKVATGAEVFQGRNRDKDFQKVATHAFVFLLLRTDADAGNYGKSYFIIESRPTFAKSYDFWCCSKINKFKPIVMGYPFNPQKEWSREP